MNKNIQLVILLQVCTHIAATFGDNKRPTETSCSPDFVNLAKSSIYVDKTTMISEFFDKCNRSKRQFQLITCPHKFGKTINLDMMKKFMEINVDKNGHVVNKQNTDIYKLLTNTTLKLNIASSLQPTSDLYKLHFQEYAVIYVSFKCSATQNFTTETLLANLRNNLRKCFQEYEWLYEISSKNKSLALQKSLTFMKKILEGRMENADIPKCLPELGKILQRYFKPAPVVLLIDDYDDPVINAIDQADFNVTSIFPIMEKLYSNSIGTNITAIKHILITGTFNILKEKEFKHVEHYNFLDNHAYVTYFGFTVEELAVLFNRNNVISNEEIARNYYGGYNVSHLSKQIYNPFSIINFLQKVSRNVNVTTENYWPSHHRTAAVFFKQNSMYRKVLMKILQTKTTIFTLEKHFTFHDTIELQHLSHHSVNVSCHQVTLLLSSLFHRGYLCYARKPRPGVFRLPNLEIKNFVRSLIPEDADVSLPQWKGYESESSESSESYRDWTCPACPGFPGYDISSSTSSEVSDY